MWGERHQNPRRYIVWSLECRFEVRHLARREPRYGRIYDLKLNLLFGGASQCNPQPRYFARRCPGIQNISFDNQAPGTARRGEPLDL
jgi:hypothetical protein